MISINLGLMLIALTTLMLELTLIRVFDVLWSPNMAYMVVTLAMFCFGLSGVYFALRPLMMTDFGIRSFLSRLAFLFALFALLILPFLNWLPLDFNKFYLNPWAGGLMFFSMYLCLILPFFFAGLVFTTVFSTYSSRIQTLYCWDLAGAAIGCVILVPFLPLIAPGGILFLAAAFALLASACFAMHFRTKVIFSTLALILMIVPFCQDDYFEFRDHIDKRGVRTAKQSGIVELSHWDPISKINVINYGIYKHIAYDGGLQSSYIYPFDGDFKKLRENVIRGDKQAFYGGSMLLSHALKADQDQDVLIIGAAGGQEIRASLMYGAAHIDAVELVGYVVELGKRIYADYNGNIFNHPHVNAFKGEGRSFLRSTKRKYDIIQIFSNHTSSSIAAGSGAMATSYLQTAEAYKEYFTHLKDDGILQVNHHVYPRMITTAALAWKQMGRTDFAKHVIVFEAAPPHKDNLPTMLIKMTPWTAAEVKPLRAYFPRIIEVVVDPVYPENNMLTPEFFSGALSAATEDKALFRVGPATDNKPYFNMLRKKLSKVEADPGKFTNFSTAALLNSQLKGGWLPADIIHLIITSVAALFFTTLFIFIPMSYSSAGRINWPGKANSLIYFSCLGAGFIIIELVFIQIFMKLIGFPLYTYSTVFFSLLLAAGLGSVFSGRIGVGPDRLWRLPFVGVLLSTGILLLSYQPVFDCFLQSALPLRITVAIGLISPVGFFLGMPFPLGILTIERQPTGAVAWAWAMNGLFTVIGGILSVLLSIFFGFQFTLLFAMLIYGLALCMYSRLRTHIA